MAFRAARRAHVPFVATYHAGRLRGSSPALGLLAAADRATFERSMLAGSAALVAVSPYVRDHALRRRRAPVSVIPPGVDHRRYCPNGVRRSSAGLLFVGPLDRSYRWKGIDVLLQAFNGMRRARPDATLTLVGEGDRRAEFERRAQADPALRVLPRLPDADLIDEYRRAAVVVLPSTTDAESFGMVLAEANACGAPVVASRVGGIPNFVRQCDNGLLAEPGDAADLARQVLNVLDDAKGARAMGERGRRRVVAEHDWDDLAARTEAVLETATTATATRAR
jgi:glycosyltransferase involved in cell wall biosynthesis